MTKDNLAQANIGDDVMNLLGKHGAGLKKYHEISHQELIEEIRSRWPLLNETRDLADSSGEKI